MRIPVRSETNTFTTRDRASVTIDDIRVGLWFRPDVRGLAHVPANGPLVLVARMPPVS